MHVIQTLACIVETACKLVNNLVTNVDATVPDILAHDALVVSYFPKVANVN